MDDASDVQAICQSIAKYADAYSHLQKWQDKSRLIPAGDQKTGCIGEFYACVYLNHAYPNAKLVFGSHSQKGWDIEVRQDGNQAVRVQVKTVSAYSKTRAISPIHHGWDKLFLIFLNTSFQPTGFWVIEDNSIISEGEVRKNCKCKDPGKPTSGSSSLPFGENLIASLQAALTEASGQSAANSRDDQT